MVAPLVIRFGALGDMVLLTPVLRALAERHGAPCDVVGSGRFLDDLYAGLPFVGERFIIGSRKTPYWINPDKWALVRWLRARRPAPVYVFQVDALSLRLAGRGCAVTGSVLATPATVHEHVVEHYARITGTTAGGVELRSTPAEHADVELGSPSSVSSILSWSCCNRVIVAPCAKASPPRTIANTGPPSAGWR